MSLIRDGERVLVGGVAARPEALIRALIKNASSYRGVRIMHGLSSGGEEYLKEQYKENFIHETLFVSASTRKAVNEGRAAVYPCYYYEIGSLLKDGDIPVDVFMFQASPPDEHGYCSLGSLWTTPKPPRGGRPGHRPGQPKHAPDPGGQLPPCHPV